MNDAKKSFCLSNCANLTAQECFLNRLTIQQTKIPRIIIRKAIRKIPRLLKSDVSQTPNSLRPSSERVLLAISNFDFPYSKIGSEIGFKVIALSICLQTSMNIAGQSVQNLMQASTQTTFIRFHIDLRDTASVIVIIIYTNSTAFVAVVIVVLVVSIA